MKRKIVGLVVLGLVFLIGGLVYMYRQELMAGILAPTESSVEIGSVNNESIEVLVDDLDTAWSIVHLPDDEMLVSQRSGDLIRLGKDRNVYRVSGVQETSEGGLLGIALHPEFITNQKVYLYYTTEIDGLLSNQIISARLIEDKLNDIETVIQGIPAAANHNGGAIAFGPDDKLYITTGDAGQAELAQDKLSLAGKILRLDDDGTVPEDNPFNNPVWSYGHRNPQGLAWDSDSRLWSVEHGPSGIQSGRDELNLIKKAANYGWPEVSGQESRSDMESPVLQSGDNDTWAPAAMVYVQGKLYFTGLRGQAIYEVSSIDSQPEIKQYLKSDYGRLRAIASQEGSLYVGTSNRDGRGASSFGSDKILQIPLSIFTQ